VVVVFPRVTVSRDFIDYPYFADLGAIQAAATLRAAGADVALADALALPGSTLTPADQAQNAAEARDPSAAGDVVLGGSEDELFARIPRETQAFVVAITPFHRPPARDATLGATLARLRREQPGATIVLADLYQSGQHVVDARSEEIAASYPEIDALLRYEAEADLPGIVAGLLGRRRASRDAQTDSLTGPEGAPRAGVTSGSAARAREAGAEQRSQQAAGTGEQGILLLRGSDPPRLDELPLPAWDLVDLPAYFAFHERVTARLGRPSWAFPITGYSAPVLTSRGCPYRCVHCSSNPGSRRDGVQIAPKTQRRYSAQYLDRLFTDLVSRGVRRVHLLDELVNVNEAHFDAVLDLLRKHHLAFEIPNGLRADYLLPRHLERMHERLTTLSVSAESGVQKVVDRIVDKQLDLGAIREAAANAKAAKVPLLVHFMIGLPGETPEDIRGTLEFALDLREQHGALPSVQFATPLPGTRLSRLAVEPLVGEAVVGEAVVGETRAPRRLPVVRDWGPLFQQVPSTETAAFDADHLRKARVAYERRMRAADGPKRVIVNLTYRCNNRCPFCTTGTQARPEPDFTALRAELVAQRRLGATALSIDGGEPTLSDKLFALVAFGRKIGYRSIEVTTNGRMASYPAYAERLLRSGVSAISVSIHGPDAETHTAHVGDPEAFEQTLSGVRNLVRAGGRSVGTLSPSGGRSVGTLSPSDGRSVGTLSPSDGRSVGTLSPSDGGVSGVAPVDVGVKITLTRKNQHRLFETASLVEALGVRRLEVLLLTPFGPETPTLAPDLDAAVPEIERTLRAFQSRLEIRIHHLPPCYLPEHEEALSADTEELAGRLCTSDADVDVLAYLRDRRKKKPICATCPLAITCLGFYEMTDSPSPRWLLPTSSLRIQPQ